MTPTLIDSPVATHPPAPHTNDSHTSTPSTRLRIGRDDIRFWNVAPDRVRIEVTVHNDDELPSAPARLRLEWAPLGALVTWRPLKVLSVPPVAPRGARIARTEVPIRSLPALGTAPRVPLHRLARAAADPPGGGGRDRNAGGSLRSRFAASRDTGIAPGGGWLGTDLFQLLRRGNAHWAGNVNVFIGSQAVERHRALSLRIHPGRLNLAWFLVGSGRDAYRMAFAGAGAAWNASLLDLDRSLNLRFAARSAVSIELGAWLEADSRKILAVAMEPPARCARGALEVRIEQRSSGQQAVVEFDLDPGAQGAGCYALD